MESDAEAARSFLAALLHVAWTLAFASVFETPVLALCRHESRCWAISSHALVLISADRKSCLTTPCSAAVVHPLDAALRKGFFLRRRSGSMRGCGASYRCCFRVIASFVSTLLIQIILHYQKRMDVIHTPYPFAKVSTCQFPNHGFAEGTTKCLPRNSARLWRIPKPTSVIWYHFLAQKYKVLSVRKQDVFNKNVTQGKTWKRNAQKKKYVF